MTDEGDVSNRRRVTINKALARAQSLGIQVDADLRFAELLENWADGHITMKEARAAPRSYPGEGPSTGRLAFNWDCIGDSQG